MRLFYASDFHGSDPCFKKFINAARFYNVQVLVLGGDIAGKAILPIVRQGGEHVAAFMGREYVLVDEDGLAALERSARTAGFYPVRMTPQEKQQLMGDRGALDEVFGRAIASSLHQWLRFAEERLPEGVECYVMPGNDDPPAVEAVLASSQRILNPDGRKVLIHGCHEMISLGYSNRTPFRSPRELDDDDLGRRLEMLAGQITKPELAIFNLHCPPYSSSLDLAPELDKDLRMVTVLGRPQMIPVGSRAVRRAIECHQPLLGLHGHCHEARGVARIGRTLCLNPGSEYANGLLKGVIIDLPAKNGKVVYQFVSA